jgi:5-(carboxyamino)imidazole ribonucleotide synthase
MSPLAPGETIGILGGGQLGRMLALAAARLGFDAHIYTPEAGECATRVAAKSTIAAYDDAKALRAFADEVGVITFEFENVPAATLETLLASGKPVLPGAKSLSVGQDRVVEKNFFQGLGIETARFALVDSLAELEAAIRTIGAPAILKTRRLGYDGKGQARIGSAGDAAKAFAAISGQPAVLEGFAAFKQEISVVAARGRDGAFAAFDVSENVHQGGILRTSRAPANVSERLAEQAKAHTRRVMEALGHVGVLTVEFFVMPGGALLANEFAPRVHNSGHWTEDGAAVSQFEQHIRAIAGWPLADARTITPTEMTNLIGDDVDAWKTLSADPNARVHLYGKGEARPGRKMGHVNRRAPFG